MSHWEKKYRKYSFILYFLIICFIFLFVIKIITKSYPGKKNNNIESEKINECSGKSLKEILEKSLNSYEVEYTLYPLSNGSQEWYLRVPSDLPVPSIHYTLKQSFKDIGAHIVAGNSEPVSGRLSLGIQYGDSCFLKVYISHKKEKGWGEGFIALIIDDFGYQYNSTIKKFLLLSAELTYSVIPGTRFSSKLAHEIQKHNYELLLHLPMEPIKPDFRKEKMMILSTMNQYQIHNVIQEALHNVSGAVGMNNHMGSKITEDRKLMEIILKKIQQKDLFYIDSRTTSHSIAYDVAREFNIPTAKRDVFIDTEPSKALIKDRLWELTKIAQKKGYAIGIGHCSRMTLEVLQTEISEIQKRGFKFVKISQLIQ